jgi:hypothetical protein
MVTTLARARRGIVVAMVGAVLSGCAKGSPTSPGDGGNPVPGAPLPAGVRVPLTDMGTRTYAAFMGGLFPNASNTMPAAHSAAGAARAAAVRTRDVNGVTASNGRYVFLSIGMSNTTQEFSAFITAAASDATVDRTRLAIVDGAAGGRTSDFWTTPTGAEYDRIKTQVLQARGLSELQVAAIWLKVANAGPTRALPDPASDAYTLVTQQGQILRALKARYPNLQQVFVSSRIYAGYATSTLNPEPYAYESGFAVKWLVGAQISQMNGSGADVRAGNLDYGSVAPWVTWGPYLWADGTTARSDGLTWSVADLNSSDGTHPSAQGQTKVANMLLGFLKTSPHARCWFLAGQTCLGGS